MRTARANSTAASSRSVGGDGKRSWRGPGAATGAYVIPATKRNVPARPGRGRDPPHATGDWLLPALAPRHHRTVVPIQQGDGRGGDVGGIRLHSRAHRSLDLLARRDSAHVVARERAGSGG